MTKKVVLIKGDGTGPELAEAAMIVLDAVGADIEIIPCAGGYEWWISAGKPKIPVLLPPETWQAIEESDACLKAPTTTPPDPDAPGSVAVNIRRRFDLYANLRPVKTFKGFVGPLGEVDFLCVREATEGLYVSMELMPEQGLALALRKISTKGSERIGRVAFEQAKERGWKTVIAITKRNILRMTDSVFWDAVSRVAESYPGIELQEYYVDNMSQQLVKNPQRFNHTVLLSTNLFMDIISEEASALVGNIGMIYSANIGDSYAMFEPAHGSAPKYKGQYKVNPTATILSAAWMLSYLGFKKESESIFRAAEDVIAERRVVTYDLGGSSGMLDMAREIARHAQLILDASQPSR